MRKTIVVALLAATLTVPGSPAIADDGVEAAACPAMEGAEFGAHVADMARDGHMGSGMNPGMHRGASPMAH